MPKALRRIRVDFPVALMTSKSLSKAVARTDRRSSSSQGQDSSPSAESEDSDNSGMAAILAALGLVGLVATGKKYLQDREEVLANPPLPPEPHEYVPPPPPPPWKQFQRVRHVVPNDKYYARLPLLEAAVHLSDFEERFGHPPPVFWEYTLVSLSALEEPTDHGTLWTMPEGWRTKTARVGADTAEELEALGAIDLEYHPDAYKPEDIYWIGKIGAVETRTPLDNIWLYDIYYTWEPLEDPPPDWTEESEPEPEPYVEPDLFEGYFDSAWDAAYAATMFDAVGDAEDWTAGYDDEYDEYYEDDWGYGFDSWDETWEDPYSDAYDWGLNWDDWGTDYGNSYDDYYEDEWGWGFRSQDEWGASYDEDAYAGINWEDFDPFSLGPDGASNDNMGYGLDYWEDGWGDSSEQDSSPDSAAFNPLKDKDTFVQWMKDNGRSEAEALNSWERFQTSKSIATDVSGAMQIVYGIKAVAGISAAYNPAKAAMAAAEAAGNSKLAAVWRSVVNSLKGSAGSAEKAAGGSTRVSPIPGDLSRTVDRIEKGVPYPHRNDGSVFRNTDGKLPVQPQGYYREYVHPTPGTTGAGLQRVIVGANGEMYYSPDHYQTFYTIGSLGGGAK